MMNIRLEIPLLESILEEWEPLLGKEYLGYRNHVYRMLHFCFELKDCNQDDKEKLIIAAAFHDIGIWIENTLDYIPPSIPPAMAFLQKQGLTEWEQEIALMISEHHKLRPYQNEEFPLVELFRKGDLVDFSQGLVQFGLPKHVISEVKSAFPNAGFHAMLVKRSLLWLPKNPLRPAPMMKW